MPFIQWLEKQTQHQTAVVFKSSVIKFDKSFHLMVIYENYLICIYMNINENWKNMAKPSDPLFLGPRAKPLNKLVNQ